MDPKRKKSEGEPYTGPFALLFGDKTASIRGRSRAFSCFRHKRIHKLMQLMEHKAVAPVEMLQALLAFEPLAS